MGRLILLLGGARSGKSTLAERMARELGGDQVLFIATAQAGDDEMQARIVVHQQARLSGWRTLEAPLRVAEQLRHLDFPLPPVILLDCITLLASNVLLMLPEDCSATEATGAVMAEIEALLGFQQTIDATWIVVTNEVGMGVVPPYRLGRLYRDALGAANQKLAQAADEVLLLVAGLPWRLR